MSYILKFLLNYLVPVTNCLMRGCRWHNGTIVYSHKSIIIDNGVQVNATIRVLVCKLALSHPGKNPIWTWLKTTDSEYRTSTRSWWTQWDEHTRDAHTQTQIDPSPATAQAGLTWLTTRVKTEKLSVQQPLTYSKFYGSPSMYFHSWPRRYIVRSYYCWSVESSAVCASRSLYALCNG